MVCEFYFSELNEIIFYIHIAWKSKILSHDSQTLDKIHENQMQLYLLILLFLYANLKIELWHKLRSERISDRSCQMECIQLFLYCNVQ